MTIRYFSTWSAIVAGAVICVAACEKKSPPPPAKPSPTGGMAPTMKDTMNAAADKAKPAMEEAKARTVSAAQSALDAAKTEFESLRARAPSVPPEAKAAYDKTVADLDDNWKKAKAMLDDLKVAGTDAWRKIGTDLSDATTKFAQDVREAAKQYPAK